MRFVDGAWRYEVPSYMTHMRDVLGMSAVCIYFECNKWWNKTSEIDELFRPLSRV